MTEGSDDDELFGGRSLAQEVDYSNMKKASSYVKAQNKPMTLKLKPFMLPTDHSDNFFKMA